MSMSPEDIRRIAEAIASKLVNNAGPAAAPSAGSALAAPGPAQASLVPLGDGVFATLDDAAKAARAAFITLQGIGLEQRKAIIESMRRTMRAQAENLARLAVDESGLGRFEDKIQKNLLVTNKTPGPEELTPTAISGDHGLMLLEPAPFGVIGAITPVTNPPSTIICNAIGMVSAGNTVVFNAHPSAKRVGMATHPPAEPGHRRRGRPGQRALLHRRADHRLRGRADEAPDDPPAGGHRRPRRRRGGDELGQTRHLRRPGKPARRRRRDRGHRSGRAQHRPRPLVRQQRHLRRREGVHRRRLGRRRAQEPRCKRNGAVEIKPSDLARLEKVIFEKNAGPRGHATVNRKFVGKNASLILQELGIPAGPEVRCLIVEVPNDHPLVWTEQMMPVLPVTRVRTWTRPSTSPSAAEGGCYHTATMHSHDLDALSKMARKCNCSIFVKNGRSVDGLAVGGEGYTSFTIASPTGEGLTTPRSFSRWRRCTLVDHFRIV
jgi:aldehyde dehydrogenase